MTADVQRELAEVLDDTATGLWMAQYGPGWGNTIAAALLPTVQALIADAEKRAAARALERLGATARVMWDGTYPVQAVPLSALLDACALDPSGAADGAAGR